MPTRLCTRSGGFFVYKKGSLQKIQVPFPYSADPKSGAPHCQSASSSCTLCSHRPKDSASEKTAQRQGLSMAAQQAPENACKASEICSSAPMIAIWIGHASLLICVCTPPPLDLILTRRTSYDKIYHEHKKCEKIRTSIQTINVRFFIFLIIICAGCTQARSPPAAKAAGGNLLFLCSARRRLSGRSGGHSGRSEIGISAQAEPKGERARTTTRPPAPARTAASASP